ncbi:MAG: hypothetical protein HGB17_10225 [Syntrophobacteraceae bacterium]|nr:hypothetical protein [Syntrophobacteraceae bacterium]
MRTVGRKDEYRRLLGLSEFTTLCSLSEYLCLAQRQSLKKLFCLAEKNILLNVLHRVKGNQRDAGRILGLKSTTLNRNTELLKTLVLVLVETFALS